MTVILVVLILVTIGSAAAALRYWRAARRLREQSSGLTTRLGHVERELHETGERWRLTAAHDPLTGVANRQLCLEHLGNALSRASRHESARIAVLFLDIDRFKSINDTYGHAAGDRVLREVAARMRTVLRPHDTIGRVGGDEFLIVLDEVATPDAAMAIAQRILQQAREPIALDGGELQATLTVGIALGAPGADPAELVRDADLAMYRAKSMLRGSIEMFDPTLRLVAQSRARLERELREALDGDQFRLQYQPIVSLADGGISGFEALVRWQHPTRGLLNAASFVPLAEESGLLVPLGRWVLREACRDVKRWRVRHNRDLMVSVNMSPRELLQPELISYLKKTLSEQDVPASALRIEITESVFLEHADSVVTALAKLDGLGVKLMLDDFGTGYSSLSYLHRFPITTVKIDRYFVSRMAGESECWEIVRSILTLARNLGMEVIAEGAETPEQNDMLSALRCPFVQGFFYSRPVPSEGVDSFLRKPIHHFGLTPPDGLPAIRV